MRFHTYLLPLALLFTSCAEYATVTGRKPVFKSFQSSAGTISSFERQLAKAGAAGKRDPFASLGDYLETARSAEDYLRKNPNDREARDSYNFAVARIFSCLRNSKNDPWAQPLRVPSDSGEFILDHRRDKRKAWYPGLYNFTPADEIEAKGIYVTDQMYKDGLGAPLVAVGKQQNEDARGNFGLDKVYYGVTATAKFEGRSA